MAKAGDEYTCAACGGGFARVHDDDDPMLAEEQMENFGEPRREDDEIVCDDCYQEVLRWYGERTPEEKADMKEPDLCG